MRNSRTILVAATAAVLVAASTALMLARGPADPPAPESWKVTLLRHGQPVGTIVVEQGAVGDPRDLFRGYSAADKYSFEVEALDAVERPVEFWFSTRRLPPADRKIVEFLLLLPAASLLVCLFRNVVGLNSFGTFAPALLGLAFRDIQSIIGIAVVLGIFLLGWLLRRGLNRFHLLQVPRTSLLLSLVVLMLLLFIFGWHACSANGASVISLFPLVILTGMIERFWSMEEEEGASASIRTLCSTLVMAGAVWLLATTQSAARWLIDHPESLGLIMAAQLLLGRYTGFRIMELHRFRVMLANPPHVSA
jgi:hypothetical protein